MGNHETQVYSDVFVENSWAEEIQFKTQKKIAFGQYRVLKNHVTTQKIQEYELYFQDDQEYDIYAQSFVWRLNKQTLVKSRYFKLQNEQRFCSSTRYVKVYLQNIPVRLSNIQDIPLAQSLYILINALKGFELIYNSIGYIKPFQDLICVDRQGKVKVWLNSNLSKNYPNTQNIEQNKNGSQSKMIIEILRLIQQNTDNEQQQIPSVMEYMVQNFINLQYLTFQKIYQTIYNYSQSYCIEIPDRFQSIKEIINQQQECYDTYKTELQSQDRFIPTHRRRIMNVNGTNSSFQSSVRPFGAAGLLPNYSGNFFKSSSYNSSKVRNLSRSQNMSNNQTPMDSLISNRPSDNNINSNRSQKRVSKNSKSSNRKLSINSNHENNKLKLHSLSNRFQKRLSQQNRGIVNVKSYQNLQMAPRQRQSLKSQLSQQNKINNSKESEKSQISQKFQKFVTFQNSKRSVHKIQNEPSNNNNSNNIYLSPQESFQQRIYPSRSKLLNSLHDAQIRMSYNDRKGSQNISNLSNKASTLIKQGDSFLLYQKQAENQNEHNVKISNIQQQNSKKVPLTSLANLYNHKQKDSNNEIYQHEQLKQIDQQQLQKRLEEKKLVKFERKGLHKPTMISYYNGVPSNNSNPSFNTFNTMKFSTNQINLQPIQHQVSLQQIYSDQAKSNRQNSSSVNPLDSNIPFGSRNSALNNLQRIRPITGRTVFQDDSSSQMDWKWRQNTNFGIAINSNNYFGKSQQQMQSQEKKRRKSDDQIQLTKLNSINDQVKINWRSNIQNNIKHEQIIQDSQEFEQNSKKFLKIPTKKSIKRLRESQQLVRQLQLFQIDAEIANDLQKYMIEV